MRQQLKTAVAILMAAAGATRLTAETNCDRFAGIHASGKVTLKPQTLTSWCLGFFLACWPRRAKPHLHVDPSLSWRYGAYVCRLWPVLAAQA